MQHRALTGRRLVQGRGRRQGREQGLLDAAIEWAAPAGLLELRARLELEQREASIPLAAPARLVGWRREWRRAQCAIQCRQDAFPDAVLSCLTCAACSSRAAALRVRRRVRVCIFIRRSALSKTICNLAFGWVKLNCRKNTEYVFRSTRLAQLLSDAHRSCPGPLLERPSRGLL